MRYGDEARRAVTVFYPPGLLASALTAGLSGLGWQVRAPGGTSDECVVVAVEGGDGRPAVTELRPRPAARLVLVGGPGYLAVLADAALVLRASAAVNADLPFADVLRRTDAALRAEPASAAARELLARLRGRLAEADRFELLTNREAVVLADLARGLSAADIASSRSVALATVRSQIGAILRKLEVPSQTAAVALAHRSCGDGRILAALRFHQNYG